MASNEEYDKIFNSLESDDEKAKSIELDKKTTECFRRVFSTSDGRVVLNQILKDLCFFNYKITGPEETALNNYAKFMIFKRLGCNNDMQISNAIFDCRKEN